MSTTQTAPKPQAPAARKTSTTSTADRQARYINDYRNATHDVESGKHAANVAAVAYFRTLPETVTVTTNKSQTQKPVSMRERAAQTLEALCVAVERDGKGKVTKGLDTIGFTVQRLTQVVDAFTNAEATGLVKVDALAGKGRNKPPAGEVEALVSALDQAAVVGGKKAAQALASEVREGGLDNVGAAGEALAARVKDMRDAKKEQAKESPVTKTPAQIVGDAVAALWDALEANAENLDAGQKSAMLARVTEMQKFLN